MGTDCIYKYKLTNAPGQDNPYKMEIKEIWYGMYMYLYVLDMQKVSVKREKKYPILTSFIVVQLVKYFVL